jgi:hypothetical protein
MIGQSIMQNHIEQRLVHMDASVVFNKAHLAEAVHEEADLDRVVPIISARVSCVIIGINVSGPPGLPNSAINRRIRARRFSLELNN